MFSPYPAPEISMLQGTMPFITTLAANFGLAVMPGFINERLVMPARVCYAVAGSSRCVVQIALATVLEIGLA